MPALIQFRRDTASNWTSNNPTLANGEFAIETDTTKYKIGDGSTAWTSLAYGGLGSIDTALIDAKGDLIVGSADNTVARVAVGSNGQVLVADSAQTAGIKWVDQESIVNWHEAVKLGTAAALPNSPTYDNGTSGVGATLTSGSNIRLVVDGTNATTGDRVLVQDQSTAAHNGLYDVTTQGSGSAAWVLTRAVDFDGSPTGQIKAGESVYVLSGSTNNGQGFVVTSTSDPHTVGTHDITFTQFTGTQAITAGTGASITGNTINVGTANSARIVVNADDVDLATTAVTAASYGSVTAVGTFTVDAYGRLTAAADATIAIPSTAVTDFTEATQDVSGAQLATNGSHTGITATYDDAGDGAIDLALVTENVQDISGAQLATNGSHTGITATYDDAGDGAIDLALVTENVQDIAGAQIATNGSHTGLTAAYDDAGDGAIDLTVAATLGTHTSGNYVATVAGTANEVNVSGSGSETAAVTIGLPDDVTIAGVLTVSGSIADGAVATTQSASDNSTKLATTAYVDTGLNALSSNSITDADGDTKIQVEESSDEDIIRFDTAGTERMTIGATGTVTIVGDLTVNGTTTTINSTTLSVDDKNIELGSVASPSDTTADGGGITLKGATDKTFNWVDSTDAWTSSEHIALATGKSVYIDGVIQLSKNSLAATVVLADGVTATTQAADDNTTKVATTAYVQTELGALSSDSIADADDDTKIEVEQSSDWDEIAFTIAGSQVMKLNANTLDVTGNVTWNTPLNAQTTSYTAVSTDKGKLVQMNSGGALDFTLPANSSVGFAVGTSIQVARMGTGTVTIAASGGVSLVFTPGLKLRARYSVATCTKIATDEWLITGDIDD